MEVPVIFPKIIKYGMDMDDDEEESDSRGYGASSDDEQDPDDIQDQELDFNELTFNSNC